jgi:hypothetical protein
VTTPPSKGLVVELYLIYFGLAQSFVDDSSIEWAGIFFFILISICYVANAQKAFDQVRALMQNLKNSNVKDQQLADVREKNERTWCAKEITKATRLLARRQHDVDSLKAHIQYLIKTRVQARKDRATRVQRIKNNLALLAKFKKQRCDNNLLFVKQLREHMQAVNVMTLLRGDIVAYFDAKPKGQSGAFIEQFEEYTALLDEEHKQIFTELKSEVTKTYSTGLRKDLSRNREHKLDRDAETNIATRKNKDVNEQGDRLTAQKERTAKQIGTGHIDNKKGALKRLKTPKHQKIGEYNTQARKRILGMIDGLIAHLRASRRKLTKDEIQASEDFAIFHNSMEKENEYLEEKIAELTKEILSLTNQLNISKVQLIKRKKLRDQAKRALALLKKMCAEKYAYFAQQTARRNKENLSIDSAMAIFNKIISSLSKRVRARASALTVNGKLSGEEALKTRVTDSKTGVKANLAGRQKVRAEIVF